MTQEKQITCVLKYTYGSYTDHAWLYAFYDPESQMFVLPYIRHAKRQGELYYTLIHGKQYILFYYHRRSYITIEREIKAVLVEICCSCDDNKLKELGRMMIEFSTFEWLHVQRRKSIIPQQIMAFLSCVPYLSKPPEFPTGQFSVEEQEKLLQMIRIGVELKEG